LSYETNLLLLASRKNGLQSKRNFYLSATLILRIEA